MTSLRASSRFASLLGLAAVSLAGSAGAQVPQPAPFYVDGQEFTTVPVDQNLSGDLFEGASWTLADIGLGVLFNALGEDLHYQTNAATEPAVFSPLCGLSGQMILRGGGCRMDFGWYCTSDPTTFVPLVTAADIIAYHDSLTGTDAQYKNDDKGFVPLIGMPPVVGEPLENIRNHPVFLACASQQIGFTIKPVAGTNGIIPSVDQQVCTQQKFSEARLNTIHAASGLPWVSALTYASTRAPGVYYVAFEDLPSDSTTFNPPVNVTSGEWVADGDFNDFVYRVQGIQCNGGGERCDTGGLGICSVGVTECSVSGEAGQCSQKFTASAEICDNIDNDCNGAIDDGDGLCTDPSTPICSAGLCVERCTSGEFVCPPTYGCDSNLNACVEQACVDIVCGENQHCEAGVCIGGCDGVVCPSGQDCLFGTCVDLCQGTTCPDGFVCQAGSCIANCQCMPCSSGFECQADGRCADTACADVSCPDGQICRVGACVNPCEGVTCPAGSACAVSPSTKEAACFVQEGGGGTGGSIEGSGGGIVVTTGGGPGPAGGTGATGANGAALSAPEGETGCGCRLGERGTSGGLAALLLLGVGLVARRRRAAR